jgi:hypothetical protein
MSLDLLKAVLSSNHTKSSTRFAQALLAYHACSRCGRVYMSVTRLANEMNIHPRNMKTLLKNLVSNKHIEPTGETTPQGVIVYRLLGVVISSPDDLNRGGEITTGGVVKSCWFCRDGSVKSPPNRQDLYRPEKGEAVARTHEEANRPQDVDPAYMTDVKALLQAGGFGPT